MDKKEIEIYVDKNNKVDCRDFLKMKIKYDVEYQEKDKEIERLNNIIERYKKHIEDIDKWINYNAENGDIYFYDPTPFPVLDIKEKKEWKD